MEITVDDQVSGRDPNKRVFFFKRVRLDREIFDFLGPEI